MAEDLTVTRIGYGAMQLAGPRVFGPPRDRSAAVAVLRAAIDLGITHIDTSDYYGPHYTNEIIKEALHPYPGDLRIVTKVGARRDAQGGWPPALSPKELRQAVYDNLKNLGLDSLDVVNLRVGGFSAAEPGSIAESFSTLTQLQQEGLIRHLGVSTVSRAADCRSPIDRPDRLRAELLQHRPSKRRRLNRCAGGARDRLCPVLSSRRLHAAAVQDAALGGGAPRHNAQWVLRLRGCCSARRTFCSFPGRRRSSTCMRT